MVSEYEQFDQVDWETVIRTLISNAQYTGHMIFPNRAGFNSDIQWTDVRAKPTWAQVIDLWTNPTSAASGVTYERNAPGDIKISPMTIDHGNWLLVDPTAGRVLIRDAYPILFHVLGTAYNSLYPAITIDQFGLPIPGGRFPIITGAGMPLGKHGGNNSKSAKKGGQPAADDAETHPYWVGGSLFVFAGELKTT